MNLPWALGACGVSPAAGGDLIVVQIVGAALRTGQKHLLPVPINYRRPSCFALLRWNGLTVGRTTSCRDVCEPTWQEQVSLQGEVEGMDEVVHPVVDTASWYVPHEWVHCLSAAVNV